MIIGGSRFKRGVLISDQILGVNEFGVCCIGVKAAFEGGAYLHIIRG